MKGRMNSQSLRKLILAISLVTPAVLTAAQREATPEVAGPADFSHAFSKIAESVNPAVVNITCSDVESTGSDTADLEMDPENNYGFGSGVIIDSEGHILTSNHVIEAADRIEVKLSDNRQFVAKLIGRDPETDLALIKVESKEGLPAAILGDSDQLKPGQWVMAIGNPFVYDHSVTVGVISALNRRLGTTVFDDFIQTDAAINLGNSGGPLLNLKGEVIGINTLISSQGTGIGFSIPINTAKQILPQLKEKGKVSRGFLGLVPQEITTELRKSMDLQTVQGVIVASVQRGSPADGAGLQRYDVILEVDAQVVESEDHFRKLIAERAPGEKVPMTVMRNGNRITLEAQLTEREAGKGPTVIPPIPRKDQNRAGLQFVDLNSEHRAQLKLSRDQEGVLVSSVEPGGAGDQANLRKGDVILEVNRKTLKGASFLRKEILEAKRGDVLLLYVFRSGSYSILALAIQ